MGCDGGLQFVCVWLWNLLDWNVGNGMLDLESVLFGVWCLAWIWNNEREHEL